MCAAMNCMRLVYALHLSVPSAVGVTRGNRPLHRLVHHYTSHWPPLLLANSQVGAAGHDAVSKETAAAAVQAMFWWC